MSLTLEHLRTLSIEDLETLQRLHGDTLTDADAEKISQVLVEKRGSDQQQGDQQRVQGDQQQQDDEQRAQDDAEQQGDSQQQDQRSSFPTADEIADGVVARLAEAEKIADKAVGGDQQQDGGQQDVRDGRQQQDAQRAQGDQQQRAAQDDQLRRDDSPKTEHWFYRGGRRRAS